MPSDALRPSGYDPRPPATILARIVREHGGGAPDLAALRDAFAEAQRLAAKTWPALLQAGSTATLIDHADPVRTYGMQASVAGMTCDVLVLACGTGSSVDAADAGEQALMRAIPVVRLSADRAPGLVADAADELGLVDKDLGGREAPLTAQGLAPLVFGPPRVSGETAKLRDFLAEGPPRATYRFEYGLIIRLIGMRPRRSTTPLPDGWVAARDLTKAQCPDGEAGLDAIRAAHDYADGQALYYGEKWRSSVVARPFLLFLPNFISGAIGILAPPSTIVTVPIQVVLTAAAYWDRRQAGRGRWQQKWLEYRALAERLRCLRFLRLAGVTGFFRTGLPSGSWVDWYATRMGHSLGPPDEPTDRTAKALVDHLLNVEIARQIAYHRNAVRRFTAMDLRLRRMVRAIYIAATGLGLFIFALGLLRGGVSGILWPQLSSLGLTLAPAVIQGLGAFRVEFDLVRLAERSARTLSGLLRLTRAVRRRSASPELARLAAQHAAEIMEDEVSRWRLTLETRAARLKRH